MPRTPTVPFLMTLFGVVLLTGLGVWQLERRTWKLNLIEQIAARINADPIPIERAKALWQETTDVEYTRVHLSGRFLHDEERYLYTVNDGQQGWDVITPLATSSGDVVLVNRGFVPEDHKLPSSREDGLIKGAVELNGLLRSSERKSWFTPANAPAANRWFWRDIPGLIASLKAVEAAYTVPFLVEAEIAPVPGGWPKGGITRVNLPNRHLEYALTWFGLAIAFAIIFVLYTRSRQS
jgi:surfeit locus 1 family protein